MNSKQEISAINRRAMERCLDRDIMVSIIKSRSINFVRWIIKEFGPKGYHVTSSGSAVIGRDCKPIEVLKIQKDRAIKIIKTAEKCNKCFVVITENGDIKYSNDHPNFDYIGEDRSLLIREDDLTADEILSKTLQITFITDEKDGFNKFLEDNINGPLELRRGGTYFLNVINKNAGKVFGFKKNP